MLWLQAARSSNCWEGDVTALLLSLQQQVFSRCDLADHPYTAAVPKISLSAPFFVCL